VSGERLPGFYRLLPQLVGSCDPGGGAGGWVPPGSGLLICALSRSVLQEEESPFPTR
jgi:hypothetical protein